MFPLFLVLMLWGCDTVTSNEPSTIEKQTIIIIEKEKSVKLKEKDAKELTKALEKIEEKLKDIKIPEAPSSPILEQPK